MTNNVPQNNLNNQKMSTRPQSQKSVILLQLLILTAILLVPLTFIILDLTRSFSILTTSKSKQINSPNLNQAGSIGNEFNFQTILPNGGKSDLSNVSQQKLDTLFKNLKK